MQTSFFFCFPLASSQTFRPFFDLSYTSLTISQNSSTKSHTHTNTSTHCRFSLSPNTRNGGCALFMGYVLSTCKELFGCGNDWFSLWKLFADTWLYFNLRNLFLSTNSHFGTYLYGIIKLCALTISFVMLMMVCNCTMSHNLI